MKRRPKSRSKNGSKALGTSGQSWVILLLTLLVIITATDLFMDHFRSIGIQPREPSANISEEAGDEEIASITTEVTSTEMAEIQPQTKPQTEGVSVIPATPGEIKVEVLNGCGVRGIAARVRGVLRDRGFDVMSYGNADRQNYDKTLLIVRSEGIFSTEAAKIVAESLGVELSQIQVEPDPSLVDINVTVILGLDHSSLKL